MTGSPLCCVHALELIKEVLSLDEKIHDLALELYMQRSLLVMGRGYNYATCLEGALVSPLFPATSQPNYEGRNGRYSEKPTGRKEGRALGQGGGPFEDPCPLHEAALSTGSRPGVLALGTRGWGSQSLFSQDKEAGHPWVSPRGVDLCQALSGSAHFYLMSIL